MKTNVKNIVTSAVFGLIILIVALACVFHAPNQFSESERRELAQFPKLEWSEKGFNTSIKDYISDFEDYTLDQFPLRDTMRELKAFVELKLFNKKDNNLENEKGLTDIIYGEENLSECLQYNDKLHILTCGRRPKNPAEMLESDVMINFIEAMKQRYDYIFIDSPPVSRVNDACIISKYVDGTIIISASDEIDIDLAKLSKKRLEKVNANNIFTSVKMSEGTFTKESSCATKYIAGKIKTATITKLPQKTEL